MAAGAQAVPRRVVRPGGVSGAGRDAGAVHPRPPREEGGRARAGAPRAARDPERPGTQPARMGARHRLPGPGPSRPRPRSPRGHALAPGREPARARLRPPGDRARGPRPPAGEALVHERRASRSPRRSSRSPSYGSSTSRRSGTRSRRRTCSEFSCDGACWSERASGESRAGSVGAPRRCTASARGGSRSPTSSQRSDPPAEGCPLPRRPLWSGRGRGRRKGSCGALPTVGWS